MKTDFTEITSHGALINHSVTAFSAADCNSENFYSNPTSEKAEKPLEPTGKIKIIKAHMSADGTLVSNPEPDPIVEEEMCETDLAWDLANLKPMELRRTYKREASSHRNMLGRRKNKRAIVHSTFLNFRDFLSEVGAMPAKCATLDRINNADPEYAPGKVRWADKRTQNSNKGDSLIFHHPITNHTFTVARLAKLQKVQVGTIRKRFTSGWSDGEIIAGKRREAKPVSNALKPGPIFSPRQGERRWTIEWAAAIARWDVPNIVKLKEWRRRFDQREEHHRSFRQKHPDRYEDLLPPPAWEQDRRVERYGHDFLTHEQWLEMLREDWLVNRLHIIFERCSPEHKKAIEQIDPGYVDRHNQALLMMR